MEAERVVFLLLWALFVTGLCVEGLRAFRAQPHRVRYGLLALFVAALLVRVVLKTNGPGDLKFDQWFFPASQSIQGSIYQYGNAPVVLYDLILRVLPFGFDVFLWGSLLLGSAVPALLVGVMRRAGASLTAAFGAGLFAALHPLMIRFSGVANRQMMLVFLVLSVLWGLLGFIQRPRLWALATFGLASVLLVHTRLEAVFLVGGLALLPLFLPGGVTRRRWVLSGALVAVAGLRTAQLLGGGAWGGDLVERVGQSFGLHAFLGPSYNVWLHPEYTPWLLPPLVVAGLVWGLRRLRGWTIWVTLALLTISYVFAPSFFHSAGLADARYQTVTISLVAGLAGFGLEALFSALRRISRQQVRSLVALALALAFVISAWPAVRYVFPSRTLDREHDFLRTVVKDLPSTAVLYYAERGVTCLDDSGLRPPDWLSVVEGLPGQTWRGLSPGDLRVPFRLRPSYYVHMAECSVLPRPYADPSEAKEEGCPPARELLAAYASACTTLLERYGDRPVSEALLPARTYSYDEYPPGPVRVGVYQIYP